MPGGARTQVELGEYYVRSNVGVVYERQPVATDQDVRRGWLHNLYNNIIVLTKTPKQISKKVG